MDPKVVYWTGALLNMAAVVALGARGVALARAGRVESHRRHMLAAVALVVAFVASYLVKLAVLGREDLASWSAGAIWVLRFHETCVLAMLVAGGVALQRGLRLQRTRLVTRAPGDPGAPPAWVRLHRGAGRGAVIAAVLGVLSAGVVLAGMYARSGVVDAPALASATPQPADLGAAGAGRTP